MQKSVCLSFQTAVRWEDYNLGPSVCGKKSDRHKGKRKKNLGAIQIVINLLMTYEKLHCKGEPYRLQRSFGTHKQPDRHTHTDTYPVPFIQGLMHAEFSKFCFVQVLFIIIVCITYIVA